MSFKVGCTVVLLLILVLTAMDAQAVHIMWSWKAPTERENGAILTPAEIKGYEVRYRAVEAPTYTWAFTAETHVDLEVPMGRYQVEVCACDTNGLCSNFITKVFDVTGHPTKGVSYPRVRVVKPAPVVKTPSAVP